MTGPDVYGSITSQGHNLVGQIDGSTGITNGVNGDLAGTTANPLDPRLATFGAYGGPMLTQVLTPDSPAVDAGDDALLYAPFELTTDRAVARARSARKWTSARLNFCPATSTTTARWTSTN